LYPYARIDGSDVEFKEAFDHERFVGKTFFLAWYYGAGASRLRVFDSSLTASDVKRGLTMLEEAHPARKDYLDETFELLNTTGYVSSLFGRKRWISKIWSPHTKERDEAMREAANMRVQATAADILKIALPRIHEALEGKESALVSTVHDEVILDTPPSEVRYVTRVVSSAFGDLLTDVDLTLETFIGETWAERNRVELEDV
jgi:DNA polymerase-1